MTVFVAEEWAPEEADVLRRYFTNLDGPVYALVNLPEVVKAALFARSSRSPKSLRRLFLDEFVGDLDIAGDQGIDATIGLRRAEELYDRIFAAYGDESVAQLGGVHLVCEQASVLLTKVLERGRLLTYLEQSTAEVPYDARIGGRYRYHRPQDVVAGPLGARYVGDMDRLFDTYGDLARQLKDYFRGVHAKGPSETDFFYREAINARAHDAVRGVLPAAALVNLAVTGTGQGYERLLRRMRSHPLPEARSYATLMLRELRKVIPSFLKRVDLDDVDDVDDRSGSGPGAGVRAMREVADRFLPPTTPPEDAPVVRLDEWDPDAEVRMVAAMLYPHSHLPQDQIERRVEAMSTDERLAVVRAYVGERPDRRAKPGRALERPRYRFDVLADYGAFRAIQRHRMLTVEWQPLSPRHGYTRPQAIVAAGATAEFDEAMARSARLHDALAERVGDQASYAVCLAYKVRFVLDLNAREAMHVVELRSSPESDPAVRAVAQAMHRLIAEVAGHHAVAELMRHVDHSDDPPLARLAIAPRRHTGSVPRTGDGLGR